MWGVGCQFYQLLELNFDPFVIAENEFFFVDPDLKLSKVAPEGWKDDPKKKKTVVNFNLFFRIKFFVDDVNLIQ